MNIMIITLQYVPDGGPSSQLFKMLCDELLKLGHKITMVAAVPHYPSGQVPKAFQHGWIQKTEEDGISVFRVRLPSINRAKLFLRLLQFLIYQIGAAWVAARQTYDIALITNPAIETFLPFFSAVSLRRKPSVFFVADVYPHVGIELGIFRHRPIIAIVKFLEQYCLIRADFVWIFSQSFAKAMEELAVPKHKQALIYGWVDTEFVKPLARNNNFALEQKLTEHFVVLYAGNLGLSQAWDTVLEVAALLQKTDSDILFVLVGDGSARAKILEQIQENKLNNVRLIPFQAFERVPEVLATADMSLMSLQTNLGTGSIPSKLFSYLASGRPILAIVDTESDAAAIVRTAQAGLVLAPDDANTIAAAIRELKANPEERENYSRQARTYAELNHSPQAAALAVEALLKRTLHAK